MIHTAAVLSRAGKVILSRQYTHSRKDETDGYLGAFSQLASQAGHSYIDIESTRLVYQEIGDLYIVLVVSKESNIIEDLKTLDLLVELTGQIAGEFNEEQIIEKSIELIFAYDECVFDGFRQNVSSQDVTNFLKMESEEELQFNRIRAEQEARAAEEKKQKIQELNEKKHDGSPSAVSDLIRVVIGKQKTQFSPQSVVPIVDKTVETAPPIKKVRGGMDLSKSTRSKAQQVIYEEGISEERETKLEQKINSNDFVVKMIEKFTALLTRREVVKEIAVEGRLIAMSGQRIGLEMQLSGDVSNRKYRFKLMQQPRGNLWKDEKKLIFNNTTGKFGPGSEVTLLCWRMTSQEADDLPINVTCWVTQSASSSIFSMDAALKEGFSCESLSIFIRLTDRRVEVGHCDGSITIVEREGYLKWDVESLEEDADKAELEFSIPICEEDAFFPVIVEFQSGSTLCNLNVDSVQLIEGTDSAPDLRVVKQCTTERFEIE